MGRVSRCINKHFSFKLALELIIFFLKKTDNRLAVRLTNYSTVVDFNKVNECRQSNPIN